MVLTTHVKSSPAVGVEHMKGYVTQVPYAAVTLTAVAACWYWGSVNGEHS